MTAVSSLAVVEGGADVLPAAADATASLGDADYRALADFRLHVRRFFAFSEQTMARAGLKPAKYQALLAIRAHDGAEPMTVSMLAKQLYIKLNSAVELVQRMEVQGFLERRRSTIDRRRSEIALTAAGAVLIERLAALHFEEHRRHLAELAQIVAALAA